MYVYPKIYTTPHKLQQILTMTNNQIRDLIEQHIIKEHSYRILESDINRSIFIGQENQPSICVEIHDQLRIISHTESCTIDLIDEHIFEKIDRYLRRLWLTH